MLEKSAMTAVGTEPAAPVEDGAAAEVEAGADEPGVLPGASDDEAEVI